MMSTKIDAYLNFNGRTREAMTFYQECFGGKLTFQKVEGTPMEALCPPEMKDHILHSSLVNENLVLNATDMNEGNFSPGNNFSLSVTCSSREDMEGFFNFFSAKGRVQSAIIEPYQGELFAAVVDKFGIGWLLNFSTNQVQM